jgi:hypothetical protein
MAEEHHEGGHSGAHGGGIGGSLTHKLGPLPVWAWAGIAVGGVLIFGRKMGGGGGAAPASSPQAAGGQLPQTVASAPIGNDPISQQYLQHIDQALNDMLANQQNATQDTAAQQYQHHSGGGGGGGLADLMARLQSLGVDSQTAADTSNFITSGNYQVSGATIQQIVNYQNAGYRGGDLLRQIKNTIWANNPNPANPTDPRNAVPYVPNQGWWNGFGYGTAGMGGINTLPAHTLGS